MTDNKQVLEVRMIIDGDDNIKFTNLDGSPLSGFLEMGRVSRAISQSVLGKFYIYVGLGLWGETEGLYKIGVSRNPDRRTSQLDADLIQSIECSRHEVWEREKSLHRHFKQYRVKGEWFKFDDKTIIDAFVDRVKTRGDLYDYLHPKYYGPMSKPRPVNPEQQQMIAGFFDAFAESKGFFPAGRQE